MSWYGSTNFADSGSRRVGGGPFATEDTGEVGRILQDKGREFGVSGPCLAAERCAYSHRSRPAGREDVGG